MWQVARYTKKKKKKLLGKLENVIIRTKRSGLVKIGNCYFKRRYHETIGAKGKSRSGMQREPYSTRLVSRSRMKVLLLRKGNFQMIYK